MQVLLTLVVLLASPWREARAQAQTRAISVEELEGNWLRYDSNNDPNDQMRTRIAGDVATLTFVPASARSFQVGQALWRDIQSDGSLQVRGSDGNYYPATLRFEGDELRLRVQHSGAGNEQHWRRAGPSVDGEWVRIATGDAAADGMRIRVDEGQATVRFLPAAAPQYLRIGSRLWQNIRDQGVVDVLEGSGRYAPGTITLEGEDRLWLSGVGAD